MSRRAIAAIALLGLAAPTWAADGNIGLFFDSGASTCSMDIPCRCLGRMYVYGLFQGASTGGITGAEYKIAVGPNTNPDPGWFFSETFDPGATVVGGGALNPVDNGLRGVNVVWPSCQQGDGYKVLIETVDIVNVNCTIGELALQVVKHDTPSNSFFQCPLFVLCDAPVYTKVCLGSNVTLCRNPEPPFANDAMCSTSGVGWINTTRPPCCLSCPPPPPADCTIAVEDKAWSAIKVLYRD